MKKFMLILIVLTFILGCENNKGQYRHNTNHHKGSAESKQMVVGVVKNSLKR
ncbi:MAG: hypothetical protein KAQ91_00250 [Methylococcales bacterium]|nr:hypothetical protein [Methylococcales bacterium]